MIDVLMPQMGESIVEGTLTKWLKKAGAHVERDEPLFEISTDKVDTEIPSPSTGTLSEILVAEGATAGINTVVARIHEGNQAERHQPSAKGADIGDSLPGLAESRRSSTPPEEWVNSTRPAASRPIAEVADDVVPLSPLVRKMAREYNIDLSTVRGSGNAGRITKQDLESLIAARSAKPFVAAPVVSQAPLPYTAAKQSERPESIQNGATGIPSASLATIPSALPPSPGASQRVELPGPNARTDASRVEPMTMMRQKIAEHMTFSKHTAAHVTTVHKVDMTKIAKMRDRAKAEFQARHGFGLTFLPFVIRAATVALQQYPIVNASIDGTNIIYHRDINIGIAVALENGLIVPVIRNADEKNVVGLQRSVTDLAARARSRQLRPDEVQAGTFSITNFGSFGSVFATPVINQPQVAILGVGAVEKVPVVIDDAIAIRSVCHLALTFDHRLIDGALADQFTGKVKSVLETWSED